MILQKELYLEGISTLFERFRYSPEMQDFFSEPQYNYRSNHGKNHLFSVIQRLQEVLVKGLQVLKQRKQWY